LRYPLLMPAICLAAGVAAGRFAAFGNRELTILICLFLALAAVARMGRSSRLGEACLLMAIFFVGSWLELLHRPGPPPVIDSAPREVLLLSGCVVEPPVFCRDRTSFVLELAPKARARVSMYPKPGESPPDLRYGQLLEVAARLRVPRNFGNPGAFDYEGYLARQNIYWTASASTGSTVRILDGRCGNLAGSLLSSLRGSILNRIDRLYSGRPYETGIMQALLMGEQSKVEDSWTDQYRVTGTYHALVISGTHLVVLTGVIVLLLRLCMIGEMLPVLAAAAAGWLYAAVTGWQTPVVRAAAGLTLVLLARFLYRHQRLLNTLAAVAIVFLVVDPHQLFEASFQLSFLCVVALAAFAIPLLERTSTPYVRGLRGLTDVQRDLHLPPKTAQFRVELRLLAETLTLWTGMQDSWILYGLASVLHAAFYVYELAAISFSIQAGLSLPMALYFHRISFSGVSANLVVVPLLAMAVPVGFFAVLTGWSVAAEAGGWLLAASRFVVDWHASWDPAWRIPDPPLWLALALPASLLSLAITAQRRALWRWAAAGASALFLALMLWYPFAPQLQAGKLEVTAIDVGQGDALLVAFPNGQTLLVDGGGVPSYSGRRSALDTGEDVVAPYLWTRGIRRVDAIAVSHFHEDHAGGVPSLIRAFRPREIWTGPRHEPEVAGRVIEAARGLGIPLRELAAGDGFRFGGATIAVLAPAGYSTDAEGASDQDSLVLRVSLGSRSFLLTGDMPPETEQSLVGSGALLRTDVLKVPHHGSRPSAGEPMLGRLRPSLALISAGFQNPYGHPHRDVLKRLLEARSTALRTDVWGLVTVRTDGRRLELDTNLWRLEQRSYFGSSEASSASSAPR
jgi:competence protein ComEC